MVAEPQASNTSQEELERFLLNKVENLRSIVTGLEDNDSFKKLISMWAEHEERLDSCWHMLYDPLKIQEARATKYAYSELVNILDHLRGDLTRSEIELEKLRNPDKYVQKDYDQG